MTQPYLELLVGKDGSIFWNGEPATNYSGAYLQFVNGFDGPVRITISPYTKVAEKVHKETTMNTNYTMTSSNHNTVNNVGQKSEASLEQDKRSHLLDRLYSERREIERRMRKEFGLEPDEGPKSPQELVERLKEGKYTIDEEYWGEEFGGKNIEYITLRDVLEAFKWDPEDKKTDWEGFNDANEKLGEDYTAAKDKIVVLPIDKALDALNSFKGRTYH